MNMLVSTKMSQWIKEGPLTSAVDHHRGDGIEGYFIGGRIGTQHGSRIEDGG